MNKEEIAKQLPESRLWLALVEHEVIPGTITALFLQATEPTMAEVFSRLDSEMNPDELEFSGAFDLSRVLEVDPASRVALEQFIRSMPTSSEIPSMVKDRVRFALSGLREQEAALHGVQLARGNGHILALELGDRAGTIRQHLDRLSEFRSLAAQNGADAELFIQECGGVPDFSRFGYKYPLTSVIAPDSRQDLTDVEVVQGAERMALVLLKSQGFSFSGESVRANSNPRAVSAWSVVTSMLDAYNGTDLASAVDSLEPEVEGEQVTEEPSNRPDPTAAKQFFDELLASVETLSAIADQFGSQTLADLMYLQNAIAKGTFVDHYPGESSLMEVLKGLSSADRWVSYVQGCGLPAKMGK